MAQGGGSDTTAAERPIRPGLFVPTAEGRPARLLGSRCRETGAYFWPPERMNPDTRKPGTLEPAELAGRGRVVSYAIVQRGLPGFASPYAIASVALDEGPSLIAQLDDWQDKPLVLGQTVELVIGTIMTEKSGTHVLGPKFRPVER